MASQFRGFAGKLRMVKQHVAHPQVFPWFAGAVSSALILANVPFNGELKQTALAADSDCPVFSPCREGHARLSYVAVDACVRVATRLLIVRCVAAFMNHAHFMEERKRKTGSYH